MFRKMGDTKFVMRSIVFAGFLVGCVYPGAPRDEPEQWPEPDGSGGKVAVDVSSLGGADSPIGSPADPEPSDDEPEPDFDPDPSGGSPATGGQMSAGATGGYVGSGGNVASGGEPASGGASAGGSGSGGAPEDECPEVPDLSVVQQVMDPCATSYVTKCGPEIDRCPEGQFCRWVLNWATKQNREMCVIPAE